MGSEHDIRFDHDYHQGLGFGHVLYASNATICYGCVLTASVCATWIRRNKKLWSIFLQELLSDMSCRRNYSFAMGLFPNLLSGFSGGEISGFKGDMWSSVCASVALMLIVIKSGTIARDVFGG